MRVKLLIAFVFLCVVGTTVSAASVVPFSSPENSYTVLMEYLDGLDTSVYLSGYKFTSFDIANKLIESKNRGLDVKVLLEGGPVGGLSNFSKSILCDLYSYNIPVYLYNGDLSFLHAKYIIGDNKSVLVSSENFGDSGYPDNDQENRGWGTLVFDSGIANNLLSLFSIDLESTEEFTCETQKKLVRPKTVKGDYIVYKNQIVELISAPENAVEKILSLLNSANKSISIEQLYIKDWSRDKNPFLEAVIDKARKGVEVKILLDSSDFNLEENSSNPKIVEYVNGISKLENLSLEAKLIDLQSSGLRELHVKGVIVDNNKVLVSSINWNKNSPTRNREVGVIIEGDATKYYTELFLKDWEESRHITTKGKIIEESKTQILYILVFVLALSGVYYLAKHRPKKSKTFLS